MHWNRRRRRRSHLERLRVCCLDCFVRWSSRRCDLCCHWRIAQPLRRWTHLLRRVCYPRTYRYRKSLRGGLGLRHWNSESTLRRIAFHRPKPADPHLSLLSPFTGSGKLQRNRLEPLWLVEDLCARFDDDRLHWTDGSCLSWRHLLLQHDLYRSYYCPWSRRERRSLWGRCDVQGLGELRSNAACDRTSSRIRGAHGAFESRQQSSICQYDPVDLYNVCTPPADVAPYENEHACLAATDCKSGRFPVPRPAACSSSRRS